MCAVKAAVNVQCYCGPYLYPDKVAQMRQVYPVAPACRIYRTIVQQVVDCARDKKVVFDLMIEGPAKACVWGMYLIKLYNWLVYGYLSLIVDVAIIWVRLLENKVLKV